MYIAPNSTIHFLRNIPFDADYNDTIYFENATEQYNYFTDNTRLKYTLSKQMYVRHSKGSIKVKLPLNYDLVNNAQTSTAELLYDCNYMMFCNNSFKNSNGKPKWFYAFVTNIEYDNNEVAIVTYEIDDMQTWMFDYDLEQCFVEREHSATDEIGDNLVQENLDIGNEMVVDGETDFTINFKENPTTREEADMSWGIVMIVGRNYGEQGKMSIPDIHGGVITALTPIRFYAGNPTNPSVIGNIPNGGLFTDFQIWVSIYGDSAAFNLVADDIVGMYLCPWFINNDNPVGLNSKTISITRPSSFGSYTPRNNKLFTYPYMQIVLTNHAGTTQSYKYEFFRNVNLYHGRVDFKIYGQSVYSPSLICTPHNYLPSSAQSSQSVTKNFDYGVVINDFPQIAWTGDVFKAWWAQNKMTFATSTMASVLSSIASLGVGIATQNPILTTSGITGIGTSVGRAIGKVADLKAMPPTVQNLVNTSYLTSTSDNLGFRLMNKRIITAQAKIIDDYFHMFGYATHRVKTPNRNVRNNWTYTQTIGCTVKGRLPSDSQKHICQIYDKGIRFWNKNAEVGNYNFANRPINEG